jgi:protein O-mannosyl-transferase
MKNFKLVFHKFLSGHCIPVLFLIIIPVMLYYPSIKYDYTGTDDIQLIQNNNPFLQKWRSVAYAFKTNAYVSPNGIEFYRPMQMMSYTMDYHLASEKNVLLPFHVTEIALYIISLLLIYLLFLKIRIKRIPALIVTMLFAVHPLVTSTVVWIPARGDLLAAVFSLLVIVTFIDVQNGKKILAPVHFILFFCAMFSKETAVVLPIVLLALDKLLLHNKLRTWKNLLFIICWLVSVGIYFSMRSIGWVNEYPEGTLTGLAAFYKNLPVVPVFLTKIFLPFDLSTYAVYKPWAIITGSIFLVAMVLLILKDKSRRKYYIFGFSWFILFCIPNMFLRTPFAEYGREYFECWSFLPVIGVILTVGLILNSFRNKSLYIPACLSFAVIISALMSVSSLHAKEFSNSGTFADAAIHSYGKNTFAYLDRGQWKYHSKLVEEGIRDITYSIDICPQNDMAYYTRGMYYFYTRRNAEARRDLERAILLDKSYFEAYIMKGWVDFTDKQYYAAIEDFGTAIKLKPGFAWGRFLRGKMYEQIGDYENALDDISTASFMADDNAAFQDDLKKVKQKLHERRAEEKEQSEEP